MISKNIDIPIFDYKLRFLEIEGKEDVDEYKKHLKWVKARKKLKKLVVGFVERGSFDGGEMIINHGNHRAIIALYKPSSPKVRRNIIGHEKRHLEDRILEHLSIDDIETAAFLAGYLSEKLV